MYRTIAIFIVRSIGTLAGLLGFLMLYSAVHLTLTLPKADGSTIFFMIMVGVNLIIDLFCLWIAYLVWFRFSPRAVQQTCGVLGFILVGVVMTCFPPSDEANVGASCLIYLGTIVFVLFAYRLLSRYLNNVIFLDRSVPENPSGS